MNNNPTKRERLHLARVKELPCGVCNAPPPSDAHHVVQHHQYLCIPLCKDCHTNNFLGWHGQRRNWAIYKQTEMSVLNDTLAKLIG